MERVGKRCGNASLTPLSFPSLPASLHLLSPFRIASLLFPPLPNPSQLVLSLSIFRPLPLTPASSRLCQTLSIPFHLFPSLPTFSHLPYSSAWKELGVGGNSYAILKEERKRWKEMGRDGKCSEEMRKRLPDPSTLSISFRFLTFPSSSSYLFPSLSISSHLFPPPSISPQPFPVHPVSFNLLPPPIDPRLFQTLPNSFHLFPSLSISSHLLPSPPNSSAWGEVGVCENS